MQASANRAVGVAEYIDKWASYEQSSFGITNKLAKENAEWTPERIASWQSWMADQATSIWRIAQLS